VNKKTFLVGMFTTVAQFKMPFDTPKTRTETKKSGKHKNKPYSAKHIRLVAAHTSSAVKKN
jgi:hypothetical protein